MARGTVHRECRTYPLSLALTPPAYTYIRIPSNAPFRLKPSPGQGWGAFATKPIPRGALILREHPFFTIPKPHELITEEDLVTAFKRLQPTEQQQFLCVRDNAGLPFPNMTSAFAENCFKDSRAHSYGLFVIHSRINHSCLPNCKIPDDIVGQFSISSFAMRDIAAGEELCFCYESGMEYRRRAERHSRLRFTCSCRACCVGTPFHELSEMRRTIAWGLHYLTEGADPDAQERGTTLCVIFDPKLRRAAETFSIPISSRLIYRLLLMVVLEQEGLLDDLFVKRLLPTVVRLPDLFRIESNAKIAKAALAETSWMKKFCVAQALWGRVDAGDEMVAGSFRAIRGWSL